MFEVEALDMLSEASTILESLEQNTMQKKDTLVALFEYIKIAAAGSDWNRKYRKLRQRDQTAKRAGKETGWEPAYLQRMVVQAYAILKAQSEGKEPDYNVSGWLWTFEQSEFKPDLE